MELHLKKNSAAELMFPMVDKTTPETFKTGETVTDTAYYKDGTGAWTILAITDTVTEIGVTGMYSIELTAAELNHDLIMVKVTAANSADSVIIIRTFARSVDDLAYPTVTGRSLDITAGGCTGIDWANIEAPTTVVGLAGTDINKVDTCTANTDMRGTESAALAVDYTAARAAKIDNLDAAVTSRQPSGNVTVGGYAVGQAPADGVLATPANKLATDVTGKVTVGTNDDKSGYNLNADQSGVTVGTCNSNTDMRGTEGAALAVDYTAARAANLDNLDKAISVLKDFDPTAALIESYAADGAAPTRDEILCMIYSVVAQNAVAGIEIKTKKLDGITTAMTFGTDDAADPTSRTRTA